MAGCSQPPMKPSRSNRQEGQTKKRPQQVRDPHRKHCKRQVQQRFKWWMDERVADPAGQARLILPLRREIVELMTKAVGHHACGAVEIGEVGTLWRSDKTYVARIEHRQAGKRSQPPRNPRRPWHQDAMSRSVARCVYGRSCKVRGQGETIDWAGLAGCSWAALAQQQK